MYFFLAGEKAMTEKFKDKSLVDTSYDPRDCPNSLKKHHGCHHLPFVMGVDMIPTSHILAKCCERHW